MNAQLFLLTLIIILYGSIIAFQLKDIISLLKKQNKEGDS